MVKQGLQLFMRADLASVYLDKERKVIVNVNIDNIGEEDVNLHYDYSGGNAQLEVFKVEGEELVKVKEYVGLTSGTKHYTGKLRSGLTMDLQYLVTVTSPGIYFYEFSIPIEIAGETKIWSTRRYNTISW